MNMDSFPRVSLAHLPTPLEPLTRLSRYLGGPDIWIKRDDCTGLGSGGNKTRKLEFLIADALQRGADTILTLGAVQSNHVRQTAAAAARLGLACHALLETEVPCMEPSYVGSGNVLLDGLLGATVEYHEHGSDLPFIAAKRASELKKSGRRPYVIPVGGSNAIGALGYVDCARELVSQMQQAGLSARRLVHATGSAGTQAGLLVGLQESGIVLPLHGISVSADEATQHAKVRALVDDTAGLLGCSTIIEDTAIHVNDTWVGPGYGMPTEAMREAVRLGAEQEGILLDPVYSGKAMAGLIGMIRDGELAPGDAVVFLHTGGSAGLFAYDWFFNGESSAATSA
jgi:L-cysteate sulfo-lyase